MYVCMYMTLYVLVLVQCHVAGRHSAPGWWPVLRGSVLAQERAVHTSWRSVIETVTKLTSTYDIGSCWPAGVAPAIIDRFSSRLNSLST